MPFKEFKLSPNQEQVVYTRGSALQVIACAGSGKTESISRRVSAIISEGTPPESIIAFTFTEKAAIELKDRIYKRVEEIKGVEFLGRLGPMFVGTIHGYCFRLLQDHVPIYGNYDVLDEHRHAALVSRHRHELGLGNLQRQHWKSIDIFLRTVDVVENELIPESQLKDTDFGECYLNYKNLLNCFHFLTFGMIISLTVEVLQKNQSVFKRVHDNLRHLIVDEYQDINPAQEKLIELLSQPPVELCVVGDDDQAIYQWRGSDISNIVNFRNRVDNVKAIKLESNRRSRPGIVECANKFAQSIPGRLEKAMVPVRQDASPSVSIWKSETPISEANTIAEHIKLLKENSWQYRDIAILFRSVRTSAPLFIDAFEEHNIPYNCGGRTGLFAHPEINYFGELFSWMAGFSWQDERFGPSRDADLNQVVRGLIASFQIPKNETDDLYQYFKDWKAFHSKGNRRVSLVGDFYQHLDVLGNSEIDPDTSQGSARLGAFARFSNILADYENVTLRSRWITSPDGSREYKSGRDRGKPFWTGLANYLVHYAKESYEDFEGEEICDLDAVSILTVHQAKGLEWPIVFLPSLSNRRFPSSMSGRKQQWPIPDSVFSDSKRNRYEGSDADERRLFYVAITRARNTLYTSTYAKMARKVKPSPYLIEIAADRGMKKIPFVSDLPLPKALDVKKNLEALPIEVGFSDLADYEDCGYAYRLSRVFGFQRELVVELGYGRAVHYILRLVAENSRKDGKLPSADEIENAILSELYVPFANTATYSNMRRNIRKLVDRYLADWSDDLSRIWEIERPFEVHMPEGIINGRADVILDREDGRADHLAIVDYKTSADEQRDERYALQLIIYALAARKEGLEVDACYLHELKNSQRKFVEASSSKIDDAMRWATAKVGGIRSGVYPANNTEEKCAQCDFGRVCRHRNEAL